MRFHHLDLNLLVALDAILTERNVTRAADKLCISQSAASGLLSRLRVFFDDDLLVQSGRQMLPTPLALSLEEPVKRVLLDIQTNIVGGKDFVPSTSNRHFRFMASDYVTSVFLTKLFHKLTTLAPNMTFDVLPTTNQYDDALTRGDVDFLIQPNAYMSDHHPHQLLFSDHYVCAAWVENDQVQEPLSIEQYLGLGHIVINLGEKRAPSFEEAFAQKFGINRRIEVSTSNFNTLPHLLIGTQRIAVMQSRLASLYKASLPIKVVNTPEPIPDLTEHIQWNKMMDNDLAHRWLREVCMEIL